MTLKVEKSRQPTCSTPGTDLTTYDWLLVNSSAGKDSQAMLDLLVELATAVGVRDRIVVAHCDLGRVEWSGTRALAEAQAAHYGLRFEVVSRPQGDLLAHVEARGMWPSSTARYCTSDHKRGQVRTLMTRLADEWRVKQECSMMSIPVLQDYDWLLVASSGGKDSQAMIDHVVELADAEGLPRERIVVVHCDLGRVEWEGTSDLAAAQAAHYGLRFERVSRPQGDLLTQVEHMKFWPRPSTRYCTSDHKRAQIYKVMTRLAGEYRARLGKKQRGEKRRPCRILNAMGMRAEESPNRAKLSPFERDEAASNGRRTVDAWLPLHTWTTAQVWERIRASGVPHHRAYDLGMKRLSCCFCIFAPESALMIAGHHNRPLLAEYVRVEQKIGHAFRGSKTKKFHLAVIQDRLAAGEIPGAATAADDGCWNM